MSELPPQLRLLRDFYYKTALKLPAQNLTAHAPGLIDIPGFFTLKHLQSHLNNPLLTPSWFSLYLQGQPVDCASALERKPVQKGELCFLKEGIIEDCLSRGAALALRGIEFFEPGINALCSAIDAPHDCVMTSAVAFFSQHGAADYRDHPDNADMLVVHLDGQEKWRIYERLAHNLPTGGVPAANRDGALQAEITMNPGDALYLRNGTPHTVETTGAYALHMCFDICDSTIGAETALNLLKQEFDLDATHSYTPTEGVVEKLRNLAQSPVYWKHVHELEATQAETRKRGREIIGGNRITYLSRYAAATRKISP